MSSTPVKATGPVDTTGKSDTPLRGDYSAMAADYTIPQGWDAITAEEHARWRTLYDRQSALLPRYAAPEFMACLARLDARDGVPHFGRASEVLDRATGWTLVAVPGLLPNDVFFNHLAEKRFPVTNWIRRADEMDYLVEPDVFHDFFGHVPLLMHPVFADYLQAYGKKGAEAEAHGGLERLARLYWYMVEFGLISTPQGLRAYGAGMLSSRGETQYCIESPQPNRVGFDLERVMRTRYRIDDYQETYFVLDSFEQLFQATARDFAPLYAKLAGLPDLPADEVQPGDKVFTVGRQAA
ncbi:phenylalanine 4-monooxygenase [Nitrospirillum sp. BR 11828]|uniref:phenylalanine 4-monooxygenase n=1 Tax=Nitrospirillum sp. BR 11828 TaxID=3104325 RepID=UPI002ACA4362|nr:phenylalanine 4-monooxygenase [Nitrospirillum sp. BR 11828]MDZ5647073.1 phenylalanine 4-monooxygenase [Nitrospirillum sp. BR 11828]